MKKEDLIDSLKYLNDDLLNEADNGRENNKSNIKKNHINRWIAAAAVILIIFSAGGYFRSLNKGTRQESAAISRDTKIPVNNTSTASAPAEKRAPYVIDIGKRIGGAGIFVLSANDISEIQDNGPWNGQVIPDTLPVFMNPVKLVKGNFPVGHDVGKMKEILNEALIRLKVDPSMARITDDAKTVEQKRAMEKKTGDTVPDSYLDPTHIDAETDKYRVRVDYRYRVTISFKAISLPDGHGNTSFDMTKKTAEYLKSQYADIIGMREPQIYITGGDRDRSGKQDYMISFYEKGEDLTQSILNNDLRSVSFNINDGRLSTAFIKFTDLSQKAADYPTITEDQAERLLVEGNYSSGYYGTFPGLKYIEKVRLKYYHDPMEDYIVPYYDFFVRLPKKGSDGNNHYAIFSVPAISPEYVNLVDKVTPKGNR